MHFTNPIFYPQCVSIKVSKIETLTHFVQKLKWNSKIVFWKLKFWEGKMEMEGWVCYLIEIHKKFLVKDGLCSTAQTFPFTSSPHPYNDLRADFAHFSVHLHPSSSSALNDTNLLFCLKKSVTNCQVNLGMHNLHCCEMKRGYCHHQKIWNDNINFKISFRIEEIKVEQKF